MIKRFDSGGGGGEHSYHSNEFRDEMIWFESSHLCNLWSSRNKDNLCISTEIMKLKSSIKIMNHHDLHTKISFSPFIENLITYPKFVIPKKYYLSSRFSSSIRCFLCQISLFRSRASACISFQYRSDDYFGLLWSTSRFINYVLWTIMRRHTGIVIQIRMSDDTNAKWYFNFKIRTYNIFHVYRLKGIRTNSTTTRLRISKIWSWKKKTERINMETASSQIFMYLKVDPYSTLSTEILLESRCFEKKMTST